MKRKFEREQENDGRCCPNPPREVHDRPGFAAARTSAVVVTTKEQAARDRSEHSTRGAVRPLTLLKTGMVHRPCCFLGEPQGASRGLETVLPTLRHPVPEQLVGP